MNTVTKEKVVGTQRDEGKDKKEKVRPYFPGVYCITLILVIAILWVPTLLGLFWMKNNLWDVKIPYILETTVISQTDLSDIEYQAEEENAVVLKQDIVFQSDDIDAICSAIEDHVDGYISFIVGMLAIVSTVTSLIIPIYNHSFLQGDTVSGMQKWATVFQRKFEEDIEKRKTDMDRIRADIDEARNSLGIIQQSVAANAGAIVDVQESLAKNVIRQQKEERNESNIDEDADKKDIDTVCMNASEHIVTDDVVNQTVNREGVKFG